MSILQQTQNHSDDLSKLKQKIKLVENQIEVLAERISTLPKDLDLKPILDQLSKLQRTKMEFEERLKNQEAEKPKLDDPISFEDLRSFRKGLKSLVEKAESNKEIQTANIKKIVHRITEQDRRV